MFYEEMWHHHPGFTFRGSLGPTLTGHDEFAGYVDWVTASLGHYQTDILALIEEGNRVAGKMRFHGIHRKELLNVTPTGKHVWWTGMPIFTFQGGKVRDLPEIKPGAMQTEPPSRCEYNY